MVGDLQRETGLTDEQIRLSYDYYPPVKENLWSFFLKSAALTLEVFLHPGIGERSLSWPRMIFGLFWIWFMAHLFAPWDWQEVQLWKQSVALPNFSMLSLLEGGSVTTQGPTISLPRLHMVEVGRFYFIDVHVPIFTKTIEGFSILGTVLALYFAAATAHIGVLFVNNRINEAPHPLSSGRPWPFFNHIYRMMYGWNFRGDLVKQVLEPLACLSIGLFLYAAASTSEISEAQELIGVSAWLVFASMALFIRAWLENRKRKSIHLDKLASRLNSEALELQQPDFTDDSGQEFEEVPKFVRG